MISISEKLYISFDANFSCTSLSPEDQVDDLSGALHNRTGQFILPRASELFDDNDVKIICFDKFYDIRLAENFIESLHIDVIRCFGCRKYEKKMIRKSYIEDQISYDGCQMSKM